MPFIAASHKQISFRKIDFLILQIIHKERKLDLFAEICSRLAAEIDIAEFISVATRPAAVSPGPITSSFTVPGLFFLTAL